jgi:hypothetical protein
VNGRSREETGIELGTPASEGGVAMPGRIQQPAPAACLPGNGKDTGVPAFLKPNLFSPHEDAVHTPIGNGARGDEVKEG